MSRTERHTLSTANKLSSLDSKISKGDTAVQTSVQQVGIFGNHNDQWSSVKVDSDGHLQVDVVSGGGGGGDASSSNQLTMITNQTNGTQKSIILGNTAKDGSGTQYQALMDSDGRLSVDASGVTVPISASALPLPAGAATSSLQTTANGHLSAIERDCGDILTDTTSIDGKITKGSDATLTNAQQVGMYAHNGTTWKQIHSTANGNLKVSLEELDGGATGQALMENSIPVVIASDQTAVATSNTAITKGSDATLVSAQQVLIYGKDQSGNLDPINVDSQGHLKITIQDEEKALSTTTLYTNDTISLPNTASSVIAMNDKKNIQIVGKTSSSTAKIGIAFQATGTDYHPNPEYANLYYDGSVYHFAMTVQGVGANNVKVYFQTAANNVYLTYHLF